MHKRRLRGAPALKLRLLRLRSIQPSNSKHVTLRTYTALLYTFFKSKTRMGNADKAKIVVYIEFGFLILGTTVAGILVLFPSFFLDVILNEIQDSDKREQLRGELGTLTTLGAAVIAIALLSWLIIVLTLCQGVRGISHGRLLIWLIVNSLPTVVGICGMTAILIINPKSATVHIPSITFLLYKIYSLFVVRGLMKDIKTAGPPDNFHALQYRPSQRHKRVGGPSF